MPHALVQAVTVRPLVSVLLDSTDELVTTTYTRLMHDVVTAQDNYCSTRPPMVATIRITLINNRKIVKYKYRTSFKILDY